MTAVEHLRALIGNGAEPMTADSPTDTGSWVCFFCDGVYEYCTRPDRYEPHHAPDCPWLAAKRFVEEHDAALIGSCEIHVSFGPIGLAIPDTFQVTRKGVMWKIKGPDLCVPEKN
jgi:hypothetical protein